MFRTLVMVVVIDGVISATSATNWVTFALADILPHVADKSKDYTDNPLKYPYEDNSYNSINNYFSSETIWLTK